MLNKISAGSTLSGSATSFGPGDFTGAMQWDITLDRNELMVINAGGRGAIGSETPEISQVIPVGALLLMGLTTRRRVWTTDRVDVA